MVALNFPTSPTDGQKYNGYIWDSAITAWTRESQNALQPVETSATAPVSAVDGQMWWNTTDGQLYVYYDDGSSSQWVAASGGAVSISNTAPSGHNGQLWWNTDNGEMFIYYDDGDSQAWVSAGGPQVTIQATPPAGYDGQLWIDSTDGSMYAYYTPPGGGDSNWIGTVSRSGGVLQVVSTTKTDTFSTTSTSPVAITGASVSITPRSTSSKIFVSFSAGATGSGNMYSSVQLLRDTTVIGGGTAAGNRLSAISRVYNGGNEGINHVGEFLDSPLTTSTITYSLKAWLHSAGTLYFGRGSTDGDTTIAADSRTPVTITAMEIAG